MDKKEIKDLVLIVLKDTDTTDLPVNLNLIVKLYGWRVVTYEEAHKRGVLVSQSEDACTKFIEFVLDQWEYVIYYNSNASPQRIRWSIAHEIGHLIMKHHLKNQITQDNECSAHYFAEQLLMPLAVLASWGVTSVENISRTCNVSVSAALNRLPDLRRHYRYFEKFGYSKHDKLFLRQFGMME